VITNSINLLFLVPLLIIGAAATYWDLKKGVIPNKLILIGFLWGGLMYFSLFLYNTFFLGSDLLLAYIIEALMNGVIAVLTGYMIWYLNFWSAGDGKLFGLFGFLLPLGFYAGHYIDYFPAFALLANLLVPLLFLFIFKAGVWIFGKRRDIKKFLLDPRSYSRENVKRYGRSVFLFVTAITFAMIIIHGLVTIFREYLGVSPNGFVIFVLLLAVMYVINLLRRKTKAVDFVRYGVILAFFGNFAVRGDIESVMLFIRMILVFALIIGLLRSILFLYVRNEGVKRVKAKDIREGMVLTKEWKKYLTERISQLTKKGKHKSFQDIRTEGLTKKQVEIIKELFQDDEKYEVEVADTLPFASFMLLAVGISVATHTSFVPFIIYFFNSLIYF